VDGLIRHNCQFEEDAFWDAQPVKADERGEIGRYGGEPVTHLLYEF